MNILIVGGGGREHALAWKAAQSPLADRVYCAPGNAGTAREPGVTNVDIAATAIAALADFARSEDVGLTIVGPEAPLVEGIVDTFEARGLRCFGPRKDAARLEGSKAYMKSFLERHGIPTAAWASFDELQAASAYIKTMTPPVVVKADGLAAGKGVIIAASHDEAIAAASAMLQGDAFGAAGRRVVVEEFLRGEEASFIVMADRDAAVILASSQDHKARDDGDRGPNTGGMGAYSPAPVIDAAVEQRVMNEVIGPTLAGLRADGTPYRGFLYAGLMLTPDGSPRVLEFNCRFGDPETQPILCRLRSDLVAACLDVMGGTAAGLELEWDPRAAVGVVMAAGGYPGAYRRGDPIAGLDGVDGETSKVFHAGTREANGAVVTDGGRVLCVVGLGATVRDAQREAYAGVDRISWDEAYCRRDIGYRAIARERR